MQIPARDTEFFENFMNEIAFEIYEKLYSRKHRKKNIMYEVSNLHWDRKSTCWTGLP